MFCDEKHYLYFLFVVIVTFTITAEFPEEE